MILNYKPKLKNYKYLKVFIKKFAILNNDKCTSSSKLYNLLIEQFGVILKLIMMIFLHKKNK